jgi:hypothetical protein
LKKCTSKFSVVKVGSLPYGSIYWEVLEALWGGGLSKEARMLVCDIEGGPHPLVPFAFCPTWDKQLPSLHAPTTACYLTVMGPTDHELKSWNYEPKTPFPPEKLYSSVILSHGQKAD